MRSPLLTMKPKTPIEISQLLWEHAIKDLGLTEVPGPGSHPRIRQAIELAAQWLDPDDSKTAWCGCIRGLWGWETCTGMPTAHYRAVSWLNWGARVKLAEAVMGDTVVLRRPGGYHVALLKAFTPEGQYVHLLGGNQSNTTNVQRFEARLIEGIRRVA